MKKVLFIWLFTCQVAYSQADKFIGNWVSTTQLISQIGEIAHFTIGITSDTHHLYISYCYISPDQKHEDCNNYETYSATIPIEKIKGKTSFEVDFYTSKKEKGKILITQAKQYLYWKLVTRPPNSDFLPEEEVFAREL